MSDAPIWVQTLSALLTPTIAGAVGVIGFLQWRTAHQKVVLDLFEKRLAAYKSLLSLLKTIIEEKTVEHTVFLELESRVSDARFLFGNDFRHLADRLIEAAARLNVASSRLKHGEGDAAHPRGLLFQQLNLLMDIYSDLGDLARTYMQMDQKAMRTFSRWLEDANKRRLSYADEKQQ